MRNWLYICGLLLCSSCLRMDSLLFNPEVLTNYQFDNYKGSKELPDLPTSYFVADTMRTLFTLNSSSDEGTATIYACYIGEVNKINTDTVILYCHGNASHMDWYWNRAKLLAYTGSAHRYGVLLMDYRGYGMSQGSPSEKNLYADVDACLSWLKSKGLTNNRLVIYGYSLGSSAATEIAANSFTMKPSKLILEAPFASTEVMVQDGSKLALPASYFTNAKLDNAKEIQKVNQPFLWMHGTKDDFLSITTHGEVVFKNYKGSFSEAHRIDGAVHNNVPSVWGYSNYSNSILNFILR